ncbi:potassium channel family protein [Corynebacterium ammoniagenes]|uniref:NAD-binding component of Kef-type K+ transport system n=2 Tax=Corynebacterium ammoniagenes TaxID=1697 RepID=A0AAV5G9Z9_CORAM|nr:potassium channel family protein [Corynebacterium ammoniagenes]AQS74225.1 Ion channel protein [Corynebacterium ammoniagenes]NMF32992.1 potassium channel family protein [Corynebacterium ammoniagenes]GJN43493.1 NAD-binding component of Kef-type K+ transport system [Corynebacterium ammoniagenes]
MAARVRRMKNRIVDSFRPAVELSSQPDHALIDVITVPRNLMASPWRKLAMRLMWAFGLLVFVTAVVFIDRKGYSEDLTVIDAAYYAAVSLTTVGYGDIVPVTQEARLVNLLVITPARLAFLVLLVGATLSVLTDQARRTFQITRWRKTLRNHTVVIGYGTKGAGSVAALLADGISPSQIVVIDQDRAALANAEHHGLVTVSGSGTKADVLKIAGVAHAQAVVVTPSMDDTAVLCTLAVRELAPSAKIVASVRESANRHLLLQSGADSVVTSAETAGRLLGLATVTPTVVEMMEDLLSPNEGFSVAERAVREYEVGSNPRHLVDIVLAVLRNGELIRVDTAGASAIKPGDRLLYIKHTTEDPAEIMDDE